MFYGAIFLLAFSLALKTNAQIPMPCAGFDEMTRRECCPIPTIDGETSPGKCGERVGRGSCQVIGNSQFPDDVRENWPLGYFNRTCVCSEGFGGYDCGECGFGYTGSDCRQRTVRARTSLQTLTDEEWTKYHNVLKTTREYKSRYMVVTRPHTENVQALIDSMVNPTLYELFVWMHHFAAKDSELNAPKDYAHESTGFPTWHRLFLLWLEREIQVLIDDSTFTLHYWDWTDSTERTAYFTMDRLGENNNGYVEGPLFEQWSTTCWKEVTDKENPVPICNPTQFTDALRRCPDETACNRSNTNWPTCDDVNDAVSIRNYDASPFNKFVGKDKSFRNTMEGFILQPGVCTDNSLCTNETKNGDLHALTRKLHNSVHIILGIGNFNTNFEFSRKGVMADVAASPNDPIFINHHTTIDCILEEWLKWDKGKSEYPTSDEIHNGHKANDYIVPFIPLYTHRQMLKTADNFGYECTLPETAICGTKAMLSSAGQVYLVSLLAALFSMLVIGSI